VTLLTVKPKFNYKDNEETEEMMTYVIISLKVQITEGSGIVSSGRTSYTKKL
jgi:hypothetical protein